MIIYCLLLCIVAVIVYLKKKHYKVKDTFICLLLIFVSGFRYMVGIDYENYMNGYNYPEEILYEPIWYLITNVLNQLGLSFQAFFLLTSVIIILSTYKAIKKFDRSIIMMALFLFIITNLYIESMNLVRQYVAMSLSFLAFIYRYEGKIKKYICLMLLAIACHTTAFICIPIFELVRFRYSKVVQFLLIILSLTIGEIISSYLIDILISHTDSSFVYSSYLINKSYLVTTTGTYKYLLNAIALYFILRQNYFINSNLYIILNLFIISVCMYNVFLYFDVGIRLSKYFYYFIILLIPLSLKQCKIKSDYIVIVLFIIGLLLFTLKDVSSDAYNPFLFNLKLIS